MILGEKVFVFVVMVALFGVSLGAVHNVGDSAGWTTIGNIDYNKWASSKNFRVGDTLVFNYNSQFHNVKQVTLQDFQSCNATFAIVVYTSGSDSITLRRPGHYYYLCGYPGHCQAGQKVDILVKPAALPSVTPSQAPSLGSVPTKGSPSSAFVAPIQAQSSALSLYASTILLSLMSALAFSVSVLAY